MLCCLIGWDPPIEEILSAVSDSDAGTKAPPSSNKRYRLSQGDLHQLVRYIDIYRDYK